MDENADISNGPDNARVAIFPPLLLVICIGLGLLARGLWQLQAIAFLPAVVLATLCAISGLLLDRWAQRELRRAATAVHPAQPTTAIVTTGPFAVSRNPIYLGQGLLLLAVGFAAREMSYFLACIPWTVMMRYGVIAREEQYLTARFGKAYEEYMARVGRWF